MKKKKSGFTLVEVITALSMFSIIMSTFIIWLNMSSTCFMKEMREEIENTRAEDAFLFIENQIRNSSDISVDRNKNIITMNMIEKDNNPLLNKKEIIQCSDDNLVIRYEEDKNLEPGGNNIIKDIKNFKVEQCDNILFITIVFHDERKYVRCIKIIN